MEAPHKNSASIGLAVSKENNSWKFESEWSWTKSKRMTLTFDIRKVHVLI